MKLFVLFLVVEGSLRFMNLLSDTHELLKQYAEFRSQIRQRVSSSNFSNNDPKQDEEFSSQTNFILTLKLPQWNKQFCGGQNTPET